MQLPSTAPSYTYTASRFQFALLMFVTFGLYQWYWYVKCARVLGYMKGDPNLRWKIFLILVPVYGWYWFFKFYGSIEDEARSFDGPKVPPLSALAFIGAIVGNMLGFILPPTWNWVTILSFVPLAIVQGAFTRLQYHKWPTSVAPYRFRWGDWLVIAVGSLNLVWLFWRALTFIPPQSFYGGPQPTLSTTGMIVSLLASVIALGVLAQLDADDRSAADKSESAPSE